MFVNSDCGLSYLKLSDSFVYILHTFYEIGNFINWTHVLEQQLAHLENWTKGVCSLWTELDIVQFVKWYKLSTTTGCIMVNIFVNTAEEHSRKLQITDFHQEKVKSSSKTEQEL